MVSLQDNSTGLQASVTYRVLRSSGALCSRVKMTNGGHLPLTLESVTSFLGGEVAGPGGVLDDADLLWAENDWLAEARWQQRGLRDALPDLNRAMHAGRSRGRFALTNVGTWSSGTYLPMGAVVNRKTGHTLLWQIEHNGGWHWQVGEHTGTGAASTYVALLARLTPSTIGGLLSSPVNRSRRSRSRSPSARPVSKALSPASLSTAGRSGGPTQIIAASRSFSTTT